jgi:hypothetical protein
MQDETEVAKSFYQLFVGDFPPKRFRELPQKTQVVRDKAYGSYGNRPGLNLSRIALQSIGEELCKEATPEINYKIRLAIESGVGLAWFVEYVTRCAMAGQTAVRRTQECIDAKNMKLITTKHDFYKLGEKHIIDTHRPDFSKFDGSKMPTDFLKKIEKDCRGLSCPVTVAPLAEGTKPNYKNPISDVEKQMVIAEAMQTKEGRIALEAAGEMPKDIETNKCTCSMQTLLRTGCSCGGV